jgi:hypothetical protein
MAKMPSGAVASILEKEATKKTIFFDDRIAHPSMPEFQTRPACAKNLSAQTIVVRANNVESYEKYSEGLEDLSPICNAGVISNQQSEGRIQSGP